MRKKGKVGRKKSDLRAINRRMAQKTKVRRINTDLRAKTKLGDFQFVWLPGMPPAVLKCEGDASERVRAKKAKLDAKNRSCAQKNRRMAQKTKVRRINTDLRAKTKLGGFQFVWLPGCPRQF
ncbi:hypothetical protein D9X91_05920 [Falsibacillus albus]|uniref:Uncharacterized protein n=1 Tax=Falsibacillus albus TaxID=2478915 RepID=A0A3L7K2R5_9BACI|nr:hypothetical protein D9X91_05920 [Falsibacillus albus]